jgi:hypothetical protein
MERNGPAATDDTAAVGVDRATRTDRADRSDRNGDPDEFDPVGTLALILVYLGILVAAWTYVYFVEFLSRDLVVIG